jgi:hypothetical protein
MWVRRFTLSLKIQRIGANGIVLFGRKINAKADKTARILAGGRVHLGMPLSEKTHFSTLERTSLYLGSGWPAEILGRHVDRRFWDVLNDFTDEKIMFYLTMCT